MNAMTGLSESDTAFAEDILSAATACVEAKGGGLRFTPGLAQMLTPQCLFEQYVIGKVLGRSADKSLAMVEDLLERPDLPGLQADLSALAASVRREFPAGGKPPSAIRIRDQLATITREWMLNAKRRPAFDDGLDRLGRMAMRVAVVAGGPVDRQGTTKALWEIYWTKPVMADLAYEALAVIESYDQGDNSPLLTALNTTARTLDSELQGRLRPDDERLIATCLSVTGAATHRPIALFEIKELRNALAASGHQAPPFRVGTLVSAIKQLADDVDNRQSEQWVRDSIAEIRISTDEGITSLTEYGAAYLAAAEVIFQQAEEPTLPDGATEGWRDVAGDIDLCRLGDADHQHAALASIHAWVYRQSHPAAVDRP